MLPSLLVEAYQIGLQECYQRFATSLRHGHGYPEMLCLIFKRGVRKVMGQTRFDECIDLLCKEMQRLPASGSLRLCYELMRTYDVAIDGHWYSVVTEEMCLDLLQALMVRYYGWPPGQACTQTDLAFLS